LGRCRTDGRDFRGANLARVIIQFVKYFEEGVDAVRTGEHNPVVACASWTSSANSRKSVGGSIRIVGNSKNVSAERAELTRERARLFPVRVTTMRFPESGRRFVQFKSLRNATTSPKTATAGASNSSSATRWAIFSSVPINVSWRPVVAHERARPEDRG